MRPSWQQIVSGENHASEDILRSKFAWHISQCSNNKEFEILFWKSQVFIPLSFINLAFFCFTDYIYTYNKVFLETVQTWKLETFKVTR